MTELTKKFPAFIISFIVILSAVFVMFMFIEYFFLGEMVDVYGDKSMEGAAVFINNDHKGTMVWDEKFQRTYAKDLRFLGQFTAVKCDYSFECRRDTMKVSNTCSTCEIKVVTKSGSVYRKKYTNVESLSYFTYHVNDFDQIK